MEDAPSDVLCQAYRIIESLQVGRDTPQDGVDSYPLGNRVVGQELGSGGERQWLQVQVGRKPAVQRGMVVEQSSHHTDVATG